MHCRTWGSPGACEVALRPLKGLPVNLWTGLRCVASPTSAARRMVALAVAIAMVALLCGPAMAQASQAQRIIEKCGHGEPIGGFTQNAYREALKHMPTEVSEYTDCPNQIRKAELAEAGGGAGAPASGPSPNVALPLSPAEQQAVKIAHSNGLAPVRVGNEPIRPGVVHANIASAVNKLPSSLLAVLGVLVVGALALALGGVLERVRTRRDG
jgi:hypothetical protein